MDSEEIKVRLNFLSRERFNNVVAFFLDQILGYEAINIDGKGDGGTDWIVLRHGENSIRLAIQDTVQSSWTAKVEEDALKAFRELGVNHYRFFTKSSKQPKDVISLENKIVKKTGMVCGIYDGRKISEQIVAMGLIHAFLAALGEKVSQRPASMPEISLCAYTNISADRRSHRDLIYKDAIRGVAYEATSPSDRSVLITNAINFLSVDENQRPLIDRQFDSLLTHGEIIKGNETKGFKLSESARNKIKLSEGLYLSDLEDIGAAQIQILRNYNDQTEWSKGQSQNVSTLVTRMHLKEQLTLLERARVGSVVSSWCARIGDPEQQLRDMLQTGGIPNKSVKDAIGELVILSANHPVTKKLIRTVTFVALEGKDPMMSATALGNRTWESVNVLLDSSVAIPFICEQLYQKSQTYHFSASGNAVRLLQELGATPHITPAYLEECAAHLVYATRYKAFDDIQEFGDALQQSENAFIAYYYALKAEGHLREFTIARFLKGIADALFEVTERFDDVSQAARQLIPSIQSLLREYGVKCDDGSERVKRNRYDTLTKEFDIACSDSNRARPAILRCHDINALQVLAAKTELKNESWMMLTWDKLFIDVAHKNLNSCFVVTPEMALDFAQPYKKLSDSQWNSLAHRLAKISLPTEALTGRIIDRVIKMDPAKLYDAEFRENIKTYRSEAIARASLEDEENFHSWIETETTRFLTENMESSGQDDESPRSQ